MQLIIVKCLAWVKRHGSISSCMRRHCQSFKAMLFPFSRASQSTVSSAVDYCDRLSVFFGFLK